MQRLIKSISTVLLFTFALQSIALAFEVPNEKIVIAIVNFRNTSNNTDLDYLEDSIPESIITSMAKSGQLEIVERSRLRDAIKEMELGMSGVVDEKTAVEVGRAVGASAILVGSYVAIGSMIQINARLIDVETSKIIKADSKRGTVGEEIFNLMDQMAQSMEAQLLGKAPPPSTPSVVQRTPAPQPQPQMAQQAAIKPHHPLYARWWFWAIVGVGVAGGVAASSGAFEQPSTVIISVPIP